MSKKLFVVDGMAHIYRAYFGVRGLSNSAGLPTNAIFGFTSILRKIQTTYQPDYFAIAMDSKEPSFRKDIFPDYKANRAEMPEELQAQIPYIFKVCEALGVTTLKIIGYEADDIIGTLARTASERGVDTVIVSNDKDMSQLASERVSVLRVDNKSGNFTLCDVEGVKEWMGVAPDQVIDALALWGDSSDNIPGAPGIGEKGAIQIIEQFGTLEAALERYEEVKKKTYRESLRDYREQILRAKVLVTICQNAPVDSHLEALIPRPPNMEMAYALFSELEFKALTNEFSKGRTADAAATPAVAIEVARQYSQLSRADEAQKFLDGIYARDSFAFHLEDAAGDFTVCSFSFGPGHAVKLDKVLLESEEVRRTFAEIFQNGLVTKSCHDAKRALYILNKPPHAERSEGGGGRLNPETLSFLPPSSSDSIFQQPVRFEGLTDDVALAGYLLDPGVKAESVTLHGLAQRYLALNPETLSQSDSADIVMRLTRTLRPKLEAEGLTSVYEEEELPLIEILFDLECAGVKIDPKPLEELEAEIAVFLERLQKEIHDLAGGPFNISSPQQVGVVFEKLNYEVSKKTATGKVSTSAEVLEELAEKYDLPRLILEYREYEKLLNTYVTVLPRLVSARTGRLHTTFTQTVTSTGRLSSVKPNLQNIPVRTELGRRTRRAFVSDAGNVLISADYSQIELRLLAHITGDPAMTEAFQAQEDIHTRTAREVFGAKTAEELKEARRLAKATNFGIAYGVGAYGLARNVGITRKEARQAIENYFAAYPGIKKYMDETPEKGREAGFVRTMFGRIRRLPDLKNRNYTLRSRAEREAINAPIQGAAADIMKLAMIEIAKRLARERLQARMLLQVHDEILLEAPEAESAQVAALVKDAMEKAAQLNVPLTAEVHIGMNWLDAK